MCSEPVIRGAASGWLSAYSRRVAISPGISCSASRSSLRPNSCNPMSAILKSVLDAVVLIDSFQLWWSGGCGSGGQQPLVLVLLEAQPVRRLDLVGTARLGLEPRLDRLAQGGVGGHPGREGHVGQRHVEAGQELLQRPQALQLSGAVEPVARRRPRRGDQPGPLDVPEHAGGPSRRLRRLVDGEGLHRGATLAWLCQGSGVLSSEMAVASVPARTHVQLLLNNWSNGHTMHVPGDTTGSTSRIRR